MKIEKVYANEIPKEFEFLRGGTFVNVMVEDVSTEESTMYCYSQTFTKETNEEYLNKLKTRLLCRCYQEYLDRTDHKFYNRYKPKEGEDLDEIEALRDERRAFIRENENV